MSMDNLRKSNDDCQHLLDLYRLCMNDIARNTALNDSLFRMVNSLDARYPALLSAIVVAGDKKTDVMLVSNLPQIFLDGLQSMYAEVAILELQNVNPDYSTHSGKLQVLAQGHGLCLLDGMPISSSEHRQSGGLYFFAKNESVQERPNRHFMDELVSLIANLILHKKDQQRALQTQMLAEQSQANMLRMALAIEGSGTGIWDRDVPGGRIHYSPGWKAILGYTDAEISNRIEESYTRLHPEDLPHVQATIKAHFEGQTEQYVVEHRVRCKDGSYKWISSRGKVVSRAEDGSPLRMIGTTTDITVMRTLSQRLQESVDLVTCLTNEVPGLAYQYCMHANGEEGFTYLSEGIRDIYELSPTQMQDAAALVHARIHPDDFPAYRNAVLKSASRLEYLHLEYRVNLPQQGIRWRQMDARPRRLSDGSTLWHGFITDVTEHKRIEQELQELATIDFLTQIPNRRSFMGRMEEELARIQRGASKSAAVLMCDLDNFKLINDRYGHAVGDLVLRHFAHILYDELRKSDYAGRVGGEEFAVVLAGTSIADATVFAERVQKQLLDTPVNVHSHIIPVTVSVGIALMQASDIDADVSLSSSDMALYRAKEDGRNRIIVAAD